MIQRRAALFALAALMLAGPSPAKARRGRGRDDHEDAEAAVRSGQVRPLEEILAEIKKQYPGEVVGVEFESEQGMWVYEVKLIAPDGRYLEIYADARTAAIIKVEGK